MTRSKLLFPVLFSVLLAFALSACSKSEDSEDEEHFASSQQRALEKAKGVEDMLQQSEEKRRKELEQSGQ
jgi:uncharacterized lipoprotein YehR (DUF1307 family)